MRAAHIRVNGEIGSGDSRRVYIARHALKGLFNHVLLQTASLRICRHIPAIKNNGAPKRSLRIERHQPEQVGEPVVEAISKERDENGEFKSIFDFCKRVDAKFVNKKSLEGLIKAGAFSNIEKSRKQLFDNIEHILDVTSKEAKDRAMGQVSLFSAMSSGDDFANVQYQLVGSDKEYTDKEIQQFEKEFLGFYVTSHPLFSIRDKMQFLMTHRVSELSEQKEEAEVTICGLVTATRQIPTKKDPTKFLRFVTVESLYRLDV